MRGANASPAKRGEGHYAIFTEGDEGEQLIANVLLAAMVTQLSSEAAAADYIEHAYALAEGLARRSVTYRPLRRPNSRDCRLRSRAGSKPASYR